MSEGAPQENENWASERLQADEPLAPEEQERLVMMISDPDLACEVLTFIEDTGKKLTPTQAEHLMQIIEAAEETAFIFYMNLVESGVAEEPNESEEWWLLRLEKALLQIEEPSVATYLLEHLNSISDEDRERLENVGN